MFIKQRQFSHGAIETLNIMIINARLQRKTQQKIEWQLASQQYIDRISTHGLILIYITVSSYKRAGTTITPNFSYILRI